MSREARVQAFLECPIDVFETVEHRHEIWRDDPFDVPTIHREARRRFRDLLDAATATGGAPGRVLLLCGETGSGKTHLLRALRAMVHKERAGFVGYMQLTSASTHYARYLHSNLIESLEQPYDETLDPRSGLSRIATALASRAFEPGLATMLRDDEQLEPDEVTDLVYTGADRLIAQRQFQFADIDLLRALLYLYRPNPPLRARVIKYLRCERLSPYDSKMLGEMPSRDRDEDAERMVEMLGRLLSVLTERPLSLVMCLDQLEGTMDVKGSVDPFERALTTVTDLAGRVPSSIFVVSCLSDTYDAFKGQLKRTLRDRLEQEPAITLHAIRTREEATSIVVERLRHLYGMAGAPFDEHAPLDPFPADLIARQSGWRTRHIIEVCRHHRMRCRIAKTLVPFSMTGIGTDAGDQQDRKAIERWEQTWNDYVTSQQVTVPDDEDTLLELLAWAVSAAGEELESGHRFPARIADGGVRVTATLDGSSYEDMFIALCNRPSKFGHLANQISRFAKQAEKDPKKPVLILVRLDEFTSAPTVSKEIRAVAKAGGRVIAVQDTDVRVMCHLRRFLEHHRGKPSFDAWFRLENHMSRLPSIRRMLDLDALERFRPAVSAAPERRPPAQTAQRSPDEARSAPPEAPKDEEVALGTTRGLMPRLVTLPAEVLTRHAAFLGGTGSGKTTLALSIAEQLLVRGIPVTMIDRKGDLAGYARPEVAHGTAQDPRRAALIERMNVALFTPGHPHGRPLAIGVLPDGVADMSPFDRNETVAQAAQALADMLNYKTTGRDAALRAILIQALQVLAEALDRPVTLDAVVELIAEADPLLVSRVGRLDTKLFEQLVRDVETLNLTAAHLFGVGAERLDPDLLFGKGRFARPGRARLSIISTKFLRNDAEALFWVGHLLFTILRWASKNPQDSLQAALLFDEADLYLPALRQPVTKAPMESLLKRGRSAGLSVLLATQSPGDLDYRCRDNVRTWFLGRIKEPTALQKLKPMAGDVVEKLAGQSIGEFYMVDEKAAVPFAARRSVLTTEQMPESEVLELAQRAANSEEAR
jgi:energy-coupling factor transporter ATP-binding protein EcfA2